MSRNRPTSVLVIAIFHFLFAAFGLIGGLIGIGFGVVMLTQPRPAGGYVVTSNPPTMTDTMKYMDSNVPLWREMSLMLAVLGLILSITLLAAGIGLVQMKPWARRLSIGYAIGSILLQLVSLCYTVLCVIPAQMALYDQLPPLPGFNAAQAQSMTAMSKTFAGCSQFFALLGLVYPVIVLIIMLRPSVAAAFRGESPEGVDLGGRSDQGAPPSADYGREPPGYRQEPDDRYGAGPG